MRPFRPAMLCLSLLALSIPAFAQLPTGAASILNAAAVSGSTGDLVSAVPDEVIGGPGGVASGTQRPSLFTDAAGFAGLSFDGSDLLNIPSLSTTYNNFTVLIAAKGSDDWYNNQIIAAGTRSDGPALYQFNGGFSYYDADHGGGYIPYNTQGMVQGEVNTIALTSGSAGLTFAVNGVVAQTGYSVGNSAGSAWNGFNIGNNAAGNQGYKGNVYYAAVWNRQLTSDELHQANDYLRAKYPYSSTSFDTTKTRFVLAGDSLLFGAGALTADKSGWRVAAANASIPAKQVVNVSTGGRTAAQSTALISEEVLPQIPVGSDTVLLSNFGSNDIRLAGLSGAQTYDSIVAYCAAVKAARPNVRIAWITMLPSSDDAAVEVQRLSLNSLLMANTAHVDGLVYTKAGGPFDYVLDMASNVDLAQLDTLADNASQVQDPEWATTYFYTRDRVHLSNKGWNIWAGETEKLFNATYQQGTVATPEPSSLLLLVFAAGLYGVKGRRGRKSA